MNSLSLNWKHNSGHQQNGCIEIFSFSPLSEISFWLAGVVQLVGVLHKPKVHGFNSQLGHMPGLWVRAWVNVSLSYWCLSLSFSLLPLSLKLVSMSLGEDKCIHISLFRKSPTTVNIREQFTGHWYNLAAKESGLECACVNNDNFTVLVSGGGRHYWVSMCTVWPSHSKWLSE